MKISCIIPTCDRLDLLKEALQSIFNQTFKPYEIIIVNNGHEEIELPGNQDAMIKIFRIIPYAGVAQARNFGACQATGDYLAFLDDDDLWNINYLENIEKAIKNRDDLILISRLDKMEDNKIAPHRNANSNNLTIPYVLKSNPGFNGSNIAVSKRLFFSLGGFDPKLPPSEDKGFLMEALLKKATVLSLPENQAILRIHGGVPRLTNSTKMAEGIFQFTRKYSHLMNWQQFFFNWKKIYRYRFKSGNKMSVVNYFLTGFLLKITTFLNI